MFKDQKLNKSPIESILQQSFTQKPLSSVLNHNHEQFFSQKSNQEEYEHPEFKISYQAPNINIQQKLKIMQMVSLAQLQYSLQTVVSIFKNKVLTRTHYAWLKIKKAEINKNAVSIIHKADKLVVVKKMNLFCQKVNSVLHLKKLRNLGTSFTQLLIHHNKSSVTEKSSSIVSPYKVKSKMDHSQRGDSQWQLAQSQGYLDNEHLTRQNRFLKKKKQKIKAHREEFCSKIDEMLSFHEGFLSKK